MEESFGIILGANQGSEWLIPWWKNSFFKHNDLPITFFDFGLSLQSKKLVDSFAQRVELSLDNAFIKSKKSIEPSLIARWEDLYGDVLWTSRLGWFLKPFALEKAPYKLNLWLDLDCEVCGSLLDMQNLLSPSQTLSIAKDPSRKHIYNSGVILFKNNCSLISDWANACYETNHLFVSDDEVLSNLLKEEQKTLRILPETYHFVPNNYDENALIVHWMANWGKQFIELFGGFQGYKDLLLRQDRDGVS